MIAFIGWAERRHAAHQRAHAGTTSIRISLETRALIAYLEANASTYRLSACDVVHALARAEVIKVAEERLAAGLPLPACYALARIGVGA